MSKEQRFIIPKAVADELQAGRFNQVSYEYTGEKVVWKIDGRIVLETRA